MRTTIDIDGKLLSEAMRVTGLKTKRAVVEEALRMLIRARRLERDRESSRRQGLHPTA